MVVKISKHRSGWKKFVGGRRFYSSVGMDVETFRLVAGALETRWKVVKARDGVWTKADIDAAYDVAGVPRKDKARPGYGAATAPLTRAASTILSGSGLYLHTAVDKYLDQLRTLAPKQVSIDQYETARQHVSRLKKLVPDVAVERINYDDLVRLKNAVIDGKKVNGEPFAIDTITTIMACFKAFFNYLADAHRWLAPRESDKAMKVDRARIVAAADEDADEDDDLGADETQTFRVDELAYLWKIATTPMGEPVLGLGLFAGFTANDISTLRKHLVVTEGDDLVIIRKRQKTKHKQKYPTKWWLPPEVAVLVRAEMLSTSFDPTINPKGLAFLTRNNLPLVHRTDGGTRGKTDNVALVWRATVRKGHENGKSRGLSHKPLRKTGGRFVRYGLGDWKGAGLNRSARV